MSRLLDAVDRSGSVLWLDANAYAGRLLAAGSPPWLDVAAYLAWQRQAQGLLRNHVVPIDVAALFDAWLSKHETTRQAMAAKSRVLWPVKTLLADEPLRRHTAELAAGLHAVFGELPVVLVLPSPKRWVAWAYQQAFGEMPDAIEADDADSASVYVADFLRVFGDCGVDAVLLVEDESSGPNSAEDLECYGAVLNLASHYRWAIGLHLQHAGDFDASALDYVICAEPQQGARRRAGVIAPAFWNGAAVEDGRFRYLTIPADAQPESVLERLSHLRAS